VLGLFTKQWDVRDCLVTFRLLITRFFSSTFLQSFPALARLRTYVRCITRDSCYRADLLDASLKESFGERKRMFDLPDSGVSQHKLAVTTTTTSNASTRLITNYNGTSQKTTERGMYIRLARGQY